MNYQNVLYIYVTTVIGAFTFVFNFLEILYIRCSRRTRQNPIGMVYIINMALSDLFVGAVMVILKSLHPYMSTTLAGDVIAEESYHVLRFCFIRFSLLVSVFNLIALTLDRLCAIRYPFTHQRQSRTLPVKICVCVWMISFVMTSVFYCVARFRWKDSERYKDVIFPVATFPASLLFVVSYLMIFSVVKRTSVLKATNRPSVQTGEEGNSKEEVDEKKNFIRLAFKTVAIFVICWFPISGMSLLKLYDSKFGQYKALESSLFTLAFLNSLLNSFIYFAHFRRALYKTLSRVLFPAQSISSTTTPHSATQPRGRNNTAIQLESPEETGRTV